LGNGPAGVRHEHSRGSTKCNFDSYLIKYHARVQTLPELIRRERQFDFTELLRHLFELWWRIPAATTPAPPRDELCYELPLARRFSWGYDRYYGGRIKLFDSVKPNPD
jgi:hypothetical protein